MKNPQKLSEIETLKKLILKSLYTYTEKNKNTQKTETALYLVTKKKKKKENPGES